MNRGYTALLTAMILLALSTTIALCQSTPVTGKTNEERYTNFTEIYTDMVRSKWDSDKVEMVDNYLKSWQEQAPDDPEWYVAQFNYHLERWQRQQYQAPGLTLGQDSNGNPSLSFRSSTLSATTESMAAISVLNQGLKKHPQRLDMWMGLLTACIMTDDRIEFEKALNSMLDTAQTSPSQMTWRLNQGLPVPLIEFLPMSVHDYARKWIAKSTTESLTLAEKILNTGMRRFPESTYCYNSMAALKLEQKQINEAVALFEKAHAIDPEDDLIMANLILLNARINNKAKARKLLDKALKDYRTSQYLPEWEAAHKDFDTWYKNNQGLD